MDGHRGPYTPRETTAFSLRGSLTSCMVFVFLLVAGCMATGPAPPSPSPVPSFTAQNHTVTSIELVFFHSVPGCNSCDQVGRYANETVATYFGPEVAAGKITFRDVNLNLPANREIAERYGAYDNSLWAGVLDENGFHRTEIVDIWYYAYNHDDFMKYLKGVLDQKLAGTD